MPRRYLVDTDVLIDYLRGHRKAVALVKEHTPEIVLSAITVAELYVGAREDEREDLDRFVSLFDIALIDARVARLAGLIKQQVGPSHGVGLADAVLAATAELHNLKLKTLNTKHYPTLKGLRPAYRKT